MIPILWRKLRRDLWARKMSLLSLAAVAAVGAGVRVGMAGIWRDLDRSRASYYAEQRLCDFVIDAKRVPEWALREAERSIPNISELRGRVDVQTLIELPGRDEPISGQAFSLPGERRPILNDVLLRSGMWFSADDAPEALLNEKFAQANGLRPGDSIKIKLLDRQREVLVVGTAISPEFVYILPPGGGFAPDYERFGILYMPEEFLRQECDLEGAWNQLLGRVQDASPAAVERTLRLASDQLDSFGVVNKTAAPDIPSVRFLSDELTGLKVSATIMPAIFLGVAALILNVLLARLAAKQRTIIGTLRAIGYSRGAILRHYLGYGAGVGLMGGLGGLALGWWMQQSMASLYLTFYALPSIEPRPHWDIMANGLAISIAFASAGALLAARRAALLEPAVAMRPPVPERASRTPLEAIPALWNRLSFRWKMIFRAILRNPFRSVVSVLSATIAAALMLACLGMQDALNYLMDYEFSRMAHDDIRVSLREPSDPRSSRELADMPGVSETEPQLSVPCELMAGTSRKLIGVTGLPRDNRLYTPLDAAGEPIAIPSQGLILTRKLSEILHVKPGDVLRLRPLIGERREVAAPVAGVVDTFWGLSAYADLEYLSRLLGEERVANIALGTVFEGARTEPIFRELRERPSVVGMSERERIFHQLEATFGETMGNMLFIQIFFAGLIAFGAVLNASLVSLNEREREVGTLRALGFTRRQAASIFSGESWLLNGLGAFLGLFAGVGLAHLLALAYNTELYRFPVVVYPQRFVQVVFLMALFVWLAQLCVGRAIAKMDWLDSLKSRE